MWNNKCMVFLCVCLAFVVQSPKCLWESLILLHVAIVCLFLLLFSIPLCQYTTNYCSILLLMGVLGSHFFGTNIILQL